MQLFPLLQLSIRSPKEPSPASARGQLNKRCSDTVELTSMFKAQPAKNYIKAEIWEEELRLNVKPLFIKDYLDGTLHVGWQGCLPAI